MPRSFEEVVLPHVNAALNYVRWLTKNDADAEDVVQDDDRPEYVVRAGSETCWKYGDDCC